MHLLFRLLAGDITDYGEENSEKQAIIIAIIAAVLLAVCLFIVMEITHWKENKKKAKLTTENNAPPQEGSLGNTLFITFLVLLFCFFAIGYTLPRLTKENGESQPLLERFVKEDDINVSISNDFPLVITVYAKTDVYNLVLKVEYLNRHGEVIKTEYEAFGSLEEEEYKTKTISLSSLSWDDLGIATYDYSIFSGTTSLL